MSRQQQSAPPPKHRGWPKGKPRGGRKPATSSESEPEPINAYDPIQHPDPETTPADHEQTTRFRVFSAALRLKQVGDNLESIEASLDNAEFNIEQIMVQLG